MIVPQQVDLPLIRSDRDEVVVPAAPNGRSLVNGRLWGRTQMHIKDVMSAQIVTVSP